MCPKRLSMNKGEGKGAEGRRGEGRAWETNKGEGKGVEGRRGEGRAWETKGMEWRPPDFRCCLCPWCSVRKELGREQSLVEHHMERGERRKKDWYSELRKSVMRGRS